VVQELQHHCLLVDLLNLKQLSVLHSEVQKTAKANGYEPQPTKLSDYFQLETSFIQQGSNIILLVHVPCISKTKLLNIYRYVPFPFPMSSGYQKLSTSIRQSLQPQNSFPTANRSNLQIPKHSLLTLNPI
jgi:hypothetical protein